MSSDEGLDGAKQLNDDLLKLPEKIQKRIARAWTRKWATQAKFAAIKEAPVGKTRNLVSGIVARDSKLPTLRKKKSFSRSVVIGVKPAFHFHIVNLGTKPRFTGGDSRRKKKRSESKSPAARVSRGTMPANRFMQRAAAAILDQAEQDLRQTVSKEIGKFLKKSNGG